MDWFLYDGDFCHERVNKHYVNIAEISTGTENYATKYNKMTLMKFKRL